MDDPHHHTIFNQSPPNAGELGAIKQFRGHLTPLEMTQASPEILSDFGILRFLRGYQMKMEAALEAWREGLRWRAKYNANQYREALVYKKKLDLASSACRDEVVRFYTDFTRLAYWEKVGVAYPERFFHDFDMDGNPVMITSHDMIDQPLDLMTICTKEEYDEFRVARCVNLELFLDALSRFANRLVKCVYIWDLEGMNKKLWNTWELKCVKDYWGDFDNECSAAFPETAHRIVATNIPMWLIVIWNVIKRVIPARTLKKIYIVNTVTSAEHRKWNILTSSLPALLGGTCQVTTTRWFVRPEPSVRAARFFRRLEVSVGAGGTETVSLREFLGEIAERRRRPRLVLWGVNPASTSDISMTTEIIDGSSSCKRAFNLEASRFHRGSYLTSGGGAASAIEDIAFRFENPQLFFSKRVMLCVCEWDLTACSFINLVGAQQRQPPPQAKSPRGLQRQGGGEEGEDEEDAAHAFFDAQG